MDGKLMAGFGASGISITAAASSWLTVASEVVQLFGSIMAVVSAGVSLYFVIKSNNSKRRR